MADFYFGNGADQITLKFQTEGFGSGTQVFGNNGNDAIVIYAQDQSLPFSQATGLLVDGGRGDDAITIVAATGEQVRGGAGDDALRITGSQNTVSGGSGDDAISASYGFYIPSNYFGGGNSLYGDGGNDTIQSYGGNILDGGQGDDTLVSYSQFVPHRIHGYFSAGPNTMTGGPGSDTFVSSTFGRLETYEESKDGVVSEGDTIQGTMDVVTDYAPGEPLKIRATVAATEPVELLPNTRPFVPSGEYAALRGNYDASTDGGRAFTVDAEGSDLLILHDSVDFDQTQPALQFGLATGAVVLLGVTSIDDVLIA